jgi:hypothetical protein
MEVCSLGPSAAHGCAEPSIELEYNKFVKQLLRRLEICVIATRPSQRSQAVTTAPPIECTTN